MKQQKIESRNAWDGFDGTEYEYDEKAEKKYDGAIWKYLLGVGIVVFALSLWAHVRELQVIKNGTAIECEYYVEDKKKEEIAHYHDTANNRDYIFNVTMMNAVHTEETITMYYVDDINNAVPRTAVTTWMFYYAFFGTMIAISMWRIRKNKY